MQIKKWIEHNTKKILIVESIFLLVFLLFFIKSCFFVFFSNTVWEEQTLWDKFETFWLSIAFAGTLSFPFFVFQWIVFYILKIEKKWRNKTIILTITSIVVFAFCVAYISKNYQYSMKKRIELDRIERGLEKS